MQHELIHHGYVVNSMKEYNKFDHH